MIIEEFDAVIIGSGAGGAPIAHTLSRAGKSVLVLEKGPLFRPQSQTLDGLSDFKRDELFGDGPAKRITIPDVANTGGDYYSSHVEPDLNDEPHVYQGRDGQDRATIEGYTAQVVGGGTQLYGGVSLRYTPRDFRLRTSNESRTDIVADPNDDVRREARDWPISYEDLEPYYSLAERLVGINGQVKNQLKPFAGDNYQKPLKPNPISEYAHAGMTEVGQRFGATLPYRTPLAMITEYHEPSGRRPPEDPESAKTSYVNRFGCPLGLKSSTWVSLLYPLLGITDLQVLTNCVVTHLEADGTRVNKVHFLDPSGQPRTVRGKVVIVACSAIESVRLLKLSAVCEPTFGPLVDPHGILGAYFLTNCFGGANARMPARFDKTLALDADWATDCCATEDFLHEYGLWAAGVIYNNTSDQALPISLGRTQGAHDLDTLWQGFVSDPKLAGQGLVDFLDNNVGKSLSVAFMANQVPMRSNQISLHPTVRDKWDRPVAYIQKTWHSHDRAVMDAMAATCADIIRFGVDPVNGNYPIAGKGGVYQAEDARARVANHILGGARFGTDRTDSVLDVNCRVWGTENLYVTDGSFMPTSGGANPTLTIEANAFRVADVLKGLL